MEYLRGVAWNGVLGVFVFLAHVALFLLREFCCVVYQRCFRLGPAPYFMGSVSGLLELRLSECSVDVVLAHESRCWCAVDLWATFRDRSSRCQCLLKWFREWLRSLYFFATLELFDGLGYART